MTPFRRVGDQIEVRLSESEVEALGLVTELLDSVGEVPNDPANDRLTVAVYPDDAGASEEFGRLMNSEMDAGRESDRSAFDTVLEALQSGPAAVSLGEAEAWLMVLGEARLALAARLGIEEEGWGEDAAGREQPAMALLHYLSYLQGSLTEVLMETL
jgi:hypothetical protein